MDKTSSCIVMLGLLLMSFPMDGLAADPDTFSPVVSYQYCDSVGSDTNTTVASPVISYQYFDWPGDANLTFETSPNVSYFFTGYTVALVVISPNGGHMVHAGTTTQVVWSVDGDAASISFFFVEYSLTGSEPWSFINYVTGSGRSTSWAIPADAASSQARVRVRAFDMAGNPLASDMSDASFIITSDVARPLAVPDCSRNAPVSGAPVTFFGTRSIPSLGIPARTITTYAWDFRDGHTSSGPIVSHSFTAVGQQTFKVRLTVTDSAGLTDMKELRVTVNSQTLGPNTQQSKSQDPVNLATGNFIYDHTDVSIPGIGFPFEFKRTYNSQDSRFTGAPIGNCWTHSYNVQLSNSDGVVNIVFGDGRSETYTNSAGAYVAEAGVYNILTTNATGTYILSTKEQTRYNFDTSGRLASISDKNSNTLSLAYDGAGALAIVTNSAGRVITFVSDASNRIVRIVDPLNRTNAFLYSDKGDLVSATDPRGGVTHYGYDADHQMTNAIDPNGNQFVRNVYSTNRVVEAQHDALGSTTTFAYDFVTRITTVSNALGYCAIHQHDDQLRVVQITDEAGNIQNFEYDDQNNRTKVVDKNRRSTSYTYDAKGNVASKTDPKGNITVITYDPSNNPTNRVDARNGKTSFSFDGKGNLIKTLNAQNCTNAVTYDSRGLPQLIRDANGNNLTNSYDSAGNLIATRDALSYVRSYAYDRAGRKVYEVDPNSGTNRFTYDPNNNLLVTTDPLGFTNLFAYDANNNQVLIQDARGYKTIKTYDAKDRLLSISNALGGITVNAYDALDRKIAVTDARSNKTFYAYDPIGNLIAVTNASGQVFRYTYDPNGNQTRVINPLSQITTNEYDELNHLVIVTDPLGHSNRYDYDELGRRTQVTDPNSQIIRLYYDSLGRLTNVVDASTGTVSYTYDAVGNRTSMTEPNHHVTTFTYDALNRLIQKQEPIGIYKFKYDGAGNRLEAVDALSRTNRYGYDADDRLRSITYPSGTPVTFSYDGTGNRINMTDSLGSSTYGYDALGRMTNFTDSTGMTIAYAYDANGNRTVLTYPGNKVVNYTFDSLNRMVTVKDWLDGVTTNTYDAAGNIVLIQNSNGTTAQYGFDHAGRLIALTNARPDTTVISSYTLTLDGAGNHLRSSQYEPIEPVIPTQTVSYAYDTDNRLANATGTAFTYDANGNMLTEGADTFAYDYENRLIQAVVGGTNYQYQYDGVGNRMCATRGGVTTRYVLDVNGNLSHVLAETDAGGTIVAYYIYGRGLVSRIDAGGTAAYFHYDVRGSTTALSDSTGALTDEYAYDPFGNVANVAGTTANLFKYVGRYGVMDEGNGLSCIRARYYSPQLGRFVTKDPTTGEDGDSQSLNRYIYAMNNPVRRIDITGFSPKEATSVVATFGSSDLNHVGLLDYNVYHLNCAGSTVAVLPADGTGINWLAAVTAVWNDPVVGRLGRVVEGGARVLVGIGTTFEGARVVVAGGTLLVPLMTAPAGGLTIVAGTAIAWSGGVNVARGMFDIVGAVLDVENPMNGSGLDQVGTLVDEGNLSELLR